MKIVQILKIPKVNEPKSAFSFYFSKAKDVLALIQEIIIIIIII